ncbi:MAG: AraC family transcriptional regulator [Cypionkella sp.]|uniref:AraC family transcriptional regulator n=1 Tax=Cypionkella sp. TaxID=2811411 RepID=UPI00262F1EB5|nr:AraC family transcriptional regulator [Cypionkella sp.]MDB5659591.1 AraC family transcriptional regulator [Cypionkella sp.]
MANNYETRMIRVLDYIHDNPAGDLSLDAMADVAALSRFHFHRVFHALMGETASQAVRRMRMYRAAVALVQTKAPLAKIARAVGYPNLASFTRSFADSYGVPPATFRAKGELRPLLPLFRTGEPLMYDVEIRQEPTRRLAAMPHRGAYTDIGRAFEKGGAVLAARKLLGACGGMVGVYYDDPSAVAVADLSSHAGFEIASGAIEDPLEEVHLPNGRHAVLRFKGPYSGLPAAYDQLYRNWLPQSGETPADSPVFEVYLNTPMDTAPEELLTDICLPLA